jgi:hypothetical protein
MVAKMAYHQVRAEITKGVIVSYDDFYRRQLPDTLAKLQLDPSGLGLKEF